MHVTHVRLLNMMFISAIAWSCPCDTSTLRPEIVLTCMDCKSSPPNPWRIILTANLMLALALALVLLSLIPALGPHSEPTAEARSPHPSSSG